MATNEANNNPAETMSTSKENNIPVQERFNIGETTSAGPRWTRYVERFELMLEAFEITDDARKKALLLHSAGEEIFCIYSSFTDKSNLNYKQVKDQIDSYFTPKKSLEFEIYKFRTCKQNENETIDAFYGRLRNLSANCEFHDRNLEIRMQIIQKCCSDRLRKKALQQSMSLDELLSFARSLEISESQAREMSQNKESVNAMKTEEKKEEYRIKKNNEKSEKKCFRCGMKWPHDNNCPAIGKKCKRCNGLNHFQQMCRTKGKVSKLENDTNDESSAEESEWF